MGVLRVDIMFKNLTDFPFLKCNLIEERELVRVLSQGTISGRRLVIQEASGSYHPDTTFDLFGA